MKPICYFTAVVLMAVIYQEKIKISSIELIPSLYSVLLMAGFFLWLYVATFVVPGYSVKGPPLRNGRVVEFYCNALPIMILTVLLFAGLSYIKVIEPTVCYDEFWGLFLVCNYTAIAMTAYLFIRGRYKGLGTSSLWDDIVMGQELVPEVAGLKLNFFWLRPSMMLWLFINLSFAAQAYKEKNLNLQMILYQIFTNWYIVDYFVFEELVTSTWDIIAEKFGFMLVAGDLVFIPFTFTIQGWFLLQNRQNMSVLHATACLTFFVAGYLVFRLSNYQKHNFKKNPKAKVWGKEPKIVGKRLLVSGWWGLCSHPNYLGDLLLAVSYALPCGFASGVLPYFYPVYLLLLLIHRDMRDDQKCAEKYGKTWQEYRKLVPYRILPGVY